jgi:hypothetical protein
MSAHRLIRYPFGGTSIVPFDAYGRSLLRHRRHLLISTVVSFKSECSLKLVVFTTNPIAIFAAAKQPVARQPPAQRSLR